MSQPQGFYKLPTELRQHILYITFSPQDCVDWHDYYGQKYLAYREGECLARRMRKGFVPADQNSRDAVQVDIEYVRRKWKQEIKKIIG